MTKEDFIKYAKPRVKDLGTAEYEDYYGDMVEANVLMIQSDIHGVDHMKVVENQDSDSYTCLDPDTNEVLIDTPMVSPIEIALRCSFDYISPAFLDYIVEYWEDLEYLIDEDEISESVVGASWMGKDIDFNDLPTPDKQPSNSKLLGRTIKITDREEPRLYNKKLKITDVDDGSQTYINCDLPDGGYVRYNYDRDLGDKFVMSESLQLQEANSSGVYSIMNNTWVKVPNKNEAEIKDVSEQVAKLTDEANNCQEIEQIDDFMDEIYKMRQEALLNGGEFSEGNLVFKELRNNGVLQDLKDRRVELMNDLMSLGER